MFPTDCHRRLGDLSNELFENTLNQKIPRREALSDLAKIAGATALSFVAGGLIGYLLASVKEKTVTETKIIAKTKYKTKTVTQTSTSTKTITETYTTTKTEKPEINIEVQVGKSYSVAAKDYEIGLRVKASELLDGIRAYYENASTSGVVDRWKRNGLEYTSSFLTGKEIGEQRIRLEVEKDDAKAEKEFYINIGLSESEIAQSSLDRNGLKLLWRDLLESFFDELPELYRPIAPYKFDLEDVFRKEYELVNFANLKSIRKETSLFLRELLSYFGINEKSYQPILNGLKIVLPLSAEFPELITGLSNTYPIRQADAEILAKIAQDNPEKVQEYPYFTWALAKQAGSFCEYYWIDFDETLETGDKALGKKVKTSVRELWNLIFEKMVELNENGKLFIGLKKEDILQYFDEANPNRFIKADNWMREKAVSPAITSADLIHKKATMDYYGTEQYELPVRIEFILLNTQNLEKINEDVRRLFLDGEISDEKYLKVLAWGRETYKEQSPGCEVVVDDLETLFKKGSSLTKIGLKNMIFTRSPSRVDLKYKSYRQSKYEEFRVEEGRGFSWSIGIPSYRIDVWFTDRSPDGQLGFVVPDKDLKLIKRTFYDSKYTNAVHDYVALNPLKPDNAKELYIILANGWNFNDYRNSTVKYSFQD